MKKIGFVGLGSMGLAMARNLCKAGFPLVGYDPRPEAGQALTETGAEVAASSGAAARDADVLVLMVLTYAQAEEAMFGPEGAAAALRPGSTVILMSTVSPAAARRMGETLAARGINFLDAPVSGGSHGAAAGTLSIMVGGPAAVLAECRPVLEAMGERIYHVGERWGAGEAVKVVNNLLAGISLAATAEALTLAAKLGVDPAVAHDVILHGSGDCWMARSRGPRMLAGDFTTTGRLDIFVKDLGAALEAAGEYNLPLPLASAARLLYQAGTAAGWGAEDDSAIVKVYEQVAKVRVRDRVGGTNG